LRAEAFVLKKECFMEKNTKNEKKKDGPELRQTAAGGSAQSATGSHLVELRDVNGAVLNFSYAQDDLGFDALGKRLISYMGTDASRLNISAAAVAVVTGALNFYSGKLDVVRNVPNPSKGDIEAKNAAKTAAFIALDAFNALNLMNNPLWMKEDEVRVGFGDTGNSHTLRPAATTHPVGSYVSNEPGRLLARFCDEGSPRAGIAHGSDSVDVHIKFANGDGTYTIFSENYSTGHPTIKLPPECCNKPGMAKARWRNNNPERGPWSDSVQVFCFLRDELGKGAAGHG
jgi:hypothetical protein